MTSYLDQLAKLRETIESNPDLKKAIGNDNNIFDRIYEIASKHELILRQTGLIYDLTTEVILGKLSSKDFVDKLKKGIEEEKWDDFDDKKIADITADLNEKIFLPIREAMRGSNENQKQKTGGDEEAEELKKEDVLHAIENPHPATFRVQQTTENLKPKTQTVGLPPKATIPPPPPPPPAPIPESSQASSSKLSTGASYKPAGLQAASSPAHVPQSSQASSPSILEQKLSGSVKIPTETKIDVPNSAPQKYDKDPYREAPTP